MCPDRPRGGEVAVSLLLDILRDEECQRTVRYFQNSECEVATLQELVEYAITHEDPSADREEVAIRFHHVALPKLDETGVLEYDPRNHDIRYEGHALLETWQDELAAGGLEPD